MIGNTSAAAGQLKETGIGHALRIAMIVLIPIAIIVRIYLLYRRGVVIAKDTRFYLDQAEMIKKLGLSYYTQYLYRPYYWGYPTIVQALTEIDFDFRYRIIAIPFVLIFSAIGFQWLYTKIPFKRGIPM